MKWQLVFLLLMGFSLGDELGFKEALSNSDGTNRRSAHSARSAAGYFQPLLTTAATPVQLQVIENKKLEQVATNRSSHAINPRTSAARHALPILSVPPFRPIHPGDHNKPSRSVITRITKIRDEDPVTIVAVPAFAALPQSIAKVASYNNNYVQNPNNRRISYNALTAQRTDPFDINNSISQLRVVPPSTGVLPPADPLLPEAVGHALKSVSQATNISADALLASIQLRQQQVLYQQQKQLAALAAAATSTTTPSPSPPTTTPLTTTPSPTFVPGAVSWSGNPKPFSTADPFLPSLQMQPQQQQLPQQLPQQPQTQQLQPQQQPQQQSYPSAAASLDYNNVIQRSTPKPPRQKYALTGVHKVMNAPKEYYPVNYDKNFDDNFTSRVELPDTSFSCGDQKHFPGLYADEDLNCMVFHVCALTDDGLVMKSFLCPESTLFDQTILKCNWWFYVDCKASKKLYDSNIPISKSYQLMKALTFFSSYNKNDKPQT